ncbi:MAG TPA: twin-arginine translocation signal domain-containing protein, partial [Anaerolineae bacterium]|nr:twin-arginine translocation signal domain-containing protein [Anaerolineae bacterium]
MNRSHSRRDFLRYAGGAAVLTALGGPLLSACQSTAGPAIATAGPTPTLQSSLTGSVTGGSPLKEFNLTTAVTPIDLGTGEFQAWTYNSLPVGPEIRVTEGDRVRI